MRGRSLPVILVVAFAGVLGIWLYFRPDAARSALKSREAATRALAEYLASKYPNEKVLVVSNPFTQKSGQFRYIYLCEEAGIRGLQEGFSGQKVTVDFPELLPGALEDPHSFSVPPNTTTPVAFLLTENAFDTLAQKHPGCNLIVSLIGIPTNLTCLKIWQSSDVPRLAFLLPDLWMLGDRQTIDKAFKSGKVAAVILRKPGAPLDESQESSADYAKKYLLVTAENIDEMTAEYPQLFE